MPLDGWYDPDGGMYPPEVVDEDDDDDELLEELDGAGVAAVSLTSVHRVPLRPVSGFHFNPGTNNIDVMFWPLIWALPQSVSIVTRLTLTAPVMESPLSITTVVDAESADAKRIPATSDNGMLAVPKEVCISRLVASVNVPSSFVSDSNAT